MAEHTFTDETATVAVLNTLVRDMHHALGRIAEACTFVWFIALVFALIDGLSGRWFSFGLDLCGAAAFFAAGYNTWKRRRKYHPTPTTRVAPVRAQLAARRDEEQP